MNQKTLAALQRSIEHWKRLATGKRQKGETTGPGHCSLCAMFLGGGDSEEDFCKGCPVWVKTGEACCVGTPYYKAWEADEEYGLDSPEFKRAAREELKFLKSLLPKPSKKGKV